MDPRDAAVRRYQQRQHGLFTLHQALDAGFRRAAVRRRLSAGRWVEVDTRVYAVSTGVDLDPRRRTMARTLATGGVASGLTAGAIWGFVEFSRSIHVTVARARRAIREPDVHSSRDLPGIDVTTCDRIPVTTPARTLIDLAPLLAPDRFEQVFDTSIVTGVVRVDRLEARARALWHPTRVGCSVVLGLLADRHPDLAAARSALEARALRSCERAGLPRPRVNLRVISGGRTRYLDLAWPEAMVAVEVDGFVPHSGRMPFDGDRDRQNDLAVDGWTILRLTSTALRGHPSTAFAPVIAVLEQRRADTLDPGRPPELEAR